MNIRKLLLPGLAISAVIAATLAMPAFAQQRDTQADGKNRDGSAQRSDQERKTDRAGQGQSDQAKADKEKNKRHPERELEEEDDR